MSNAIREERDRADALERQRDAAEARVAELEAALRPMRQWLLSRRRSQWSEGFSAEFRRGYDTAVEEAEAAMGWLTDDPEPRP